MGSRRQPGALATLDEPRIGCPWVVAHVHALALSLRTGRPYDGQGARASSCAGLLAGSVTGCWYVVRAIGGAAGQLEGLEAALEVLVVVRIDRQLPRRVQAGHRERRVRVALPRGAPLHREEVVGRLNHLRVVQAVRRRLRVATQLFRFGEVADRVIRAEHLRRFLCASVGARHVSRRECVQCSHGRTAVQNQARRPYCRNCSRRPGSHT